MLDNYEKTEDGVIRQVERKPFPYNSAYNAKYNDFGELGTRMSYLRLGNLIASMGRVPDSILDVGYGNGDFLKLCQTIIPDCNGNDISDYPVPEGCNFVSDIFSRHFDVITFFDSLEHFPDIDWVKDLDCRTIIISLPHCHYKSDEWFDEWKHRKPDEHLWHFNQSALSRFMSRMGYHPIRLTNVEDVIRKNKPDEENILTGVFNRI